MNPAPNPSRFLAWHTFVALLVAAGLFGILLTTWFVARPYHRPQQPSLSTVLLISVPASLAVGATYWFLARGVARSLGLLVPLKSLTPLPDWQRDSLRRLVGRVQFLGFGAILLVSVLAAALRYLLPESAATPVAYLVLFMMLPPGIVSFAYRQGVHDAQARLGTRPAPERT